VGALVLVAIAVLIIILCVRKHRYPKANAYTSVGTDSLYVPMVSQPTISKDTLPLCFKLRHDVVGSDSSTTLTLTAGQQVHVMKNDYNDPGASEWVWAMDAAGRQGYVPRNSLAVLLQ
jgi:hypothetical protein